MNFHSLIFYVFAAVLIISALRVITAKNPVHAAMFLVLSFFTSAALWLLIYAEFLAITLVLVYVGAVMVLFLFVVMMLDINFDKLREGFWKYLPVAATVAVLMAGQMALLLWGKLGLSAPAYAGSGAPVAVSNTKELGRIHLYAIPAAVRTSRRRIAGRHGRRHRAYVPWSQGCEVAECRRAIACEEHRPSQNYFHARRSRSARRACTGSRTQRGEKPA